MANFIFKKLEEEKGVETHLVEEISDRETIVKKVEIVPLEIIVRNIAAGSFSKKFGVEEGTVLKNPTLEFCLKDDALGDPMINDSQIMAIGAATKEELDAIRDMTMKINDFLIEYFKQADIELVDFKIEMGDPMINDSQIMAIGAATKEELDAIKDMTMKINDFLIEYFKQADIELVDFKIEMGRYHGRIIAATKEELDAIKDMTMKINDFLIEYFKQADIELVDFKIEMGRYHGRIILADEISPDTCRLWDINTHEKLDKDRFRRDLGGVKEAYDEVMSRLGI